MRNLDVDYCCDVAESVDVSCNLDCRAEESG